MSEKVNEVLSHVVIETLEQLAYIFSAPADDTDMSTPDTMVATVPFTGPFSGRLTMEIAVLPVVELAANMLGIDESEITFEQQCDALKESLNIICGNLLPEIAGTQAIFNIGTPSIIKKENITKGIDEKAFATANLSMDDELCSIYLFIESDIPEGSLVLE